MDFVTLRVPVLLPALSLSLLPIFSIRPDFSTWLQFIAGAVVCPSLILFGVREGYLLARRTHWPDRQRAEKEQVEALQIPADVRSPETFPGVDQIDAAQEAALIVVPDSQGEFRARALTTYAAPAVAVLLASLHVAIWPTGPFGSGLVLGQGLLVAYVILRVVVDRRPAQAWIERRLRAELFRREQYLCFARVGPYFPGRSANPDARINLIRSGSIERLTELLVMQYEDEKDRATWLEYVAANPAPTSLFSDLPERVRSYEYNRAGKQIAWMRASAEDAEASARRIEWFVGGIAIANILVAVVSSFHLQIPSAATTFPAATGASGIVPLRAIVALSIFLPAVSGMLLALQSVFNLRFLSENYRLTERTLERLRIELIELEQLAVNVWVGADRDLKRQLEIRFQRLVLRVESELAAECVRWRMVTQRDAHELV